MKLIEPFTFAKVISRIKGSGLEVGETVFVSSARNLPEKRSDPYLFRVYVYVLKLEDGLVLLPGSDNDHAQYIVDPRKLSPLDEEEAKPFLERLWEVYG